MAMAAPIIPSAPNEPTTIALALNAGSSSVKLGLFALDREGAKPLYGRAITAAEFAVRMAELELALDAQLAASAYAPNLVLHRVVHGGAGLRDHCYIDAAVIAQIERASALAPLHNQAALSMIRYAQKRFPDVPQIACFDTVFHANLAEHARTFAIPLRLHGQGIERYGFHGLACASIVRQLREKILPQRIVIAHLGSGASITALQAGKSVNTSMGLTPSGGCIMATRSGDLDAGLVLHLLSSTGLSVGELKQTFDQQSGLLGISGLSGDMQILHQHSASHCGARLAIEMFCISVQKHILAMACTLGGIDLLVFSGGIGQHDHKVRARICAGLRWAGKIKTRIVPALEELEMAHIGCILQANRLSSEAIAVANVD